MNDPLVSIVIPCHNQGRYLGDAVESARRQRHGSVEVIVVDDGSSEDLQAFVSAGTVRWIRQQKRGVAAARNRGAAEARGDYLVFLDSDDRLLPSAVDHGLEALSRHPGAVLAVGRCRLIGRRGEPRPMPPQPAIPSDRYAGMLANNFIWMPAQVLYPRATFSASGGFDPSVDACADYDLYLRVTYRWAVACHEHVVAEYRSHDGNMSSNGPLMLRSALQVIDRQWRNARLTPTHRRAYWRGRRLWQDLYGDLVVEEIRQGFRRPGGVARALRAFLVLLRYHPLAAARHSWRKTSLMIRQPERSAPPRHALTSEGPPGAADLWRARPGSPPER